MQFAYRNDTALAQRVSEIYEGRTQADMIQDLNDIAVLGKANTAPLEAVSMDLTLLDQAAATADEMAEILGQATVGKEDKSPSRIIRDKAYSHLKEAVDEISIDPADVHALEPGLLAPPCSISVELHDLLDLFPAHLPARFESGDHGFHGGGTHGYLIQAGVFRMGQSAHVHHLAHRHCPMILDRFRQPAQPGDNLIAVHRHLTGVTLAQRLNIAPLCGHDTGTPLGFLDQVVDLLLGNLPCFRVAHIRDLRGESYPVLGGQLPNPARLQYMLKHESLLEDLD